MLVGWAPGMSPLTLKPGEAKLIDIERLEAGQLLVRWAARQTELETVADAIAQIRKTTLPVELRAGAVGRYAREVEAAVYFCCLEALQNVSKHAGARSIVVHVSSDDGRLVFSVADDGAGFEPKRSEMGSGLQGMKDRLAALGGDLEVSSEPGRICCRPCMNQ